MFIFIIMWGLTHATTHGMVRGISKHITDDEIVMTHIYIINKPRSYESCESHFLFREELEDGIIQSLR